jgi:putative transposase
MQRIRHSPEQIIRKLREADAELAKGVATPEICKALGIAENTSYRWRNQFGGIKADEMKRLKELERENARLKALVADLALDKAILKEAARGNS